MKIALITNYNINEKAHAAMTVAEKLIGHGATILVPANYRERINRMHRQRPFIQFDSVQNVYKHCDMIVVLGGDGTIMEAARQAAPRETPVLGINLGHLGYLAELEMSELELLDQVMAGDYRIDRRTMLNATIIGPNQKEKQAGYALNDAVISNGFVARIIDLQLSEGGTAINTYRADGLIISTPTGSTAYNLSAGGPIVEPDAASMVITPICSHDVASRCIVASDKRVITVALSAHARRNAFLSADGGKSVRMNAGDVATIKRSQLVTQLVRLKDRSFYDVVNLKFKIG